MAVAIETLVAMLLGPVWEPSGKAAVPLIALTAWLFLAFPAGVAVIARGEARYALIANVAGTLATVAGVSLARPATAVQAVVVWLVAQLFVSPYILWANARVLCTTPLRPLRAGMPMLVVSLLATGIAFAVPRLLDGPTSAGQLLMLRVVLVAAVTGPLALLIRVPVVSGRASLWFNGDSGLAR